METAVKPAGPVAAHRQDPGSDYPVGTSSAMAPNEHRMTA